MKNILLHGSLKIKYKGKILKIAFKKILSWKVTWEGSGERSEGESDKQLFMYRAQ